METEEIHSIDVFKEWTLKENSITTALSIHYFRCTEFDNILPGIKKRS